MEMFEDGESDIISYGMVARSRMKTNNSNASEVANADTKQVKQLPPSEYFLSNIKKTIMMRTRNRTEKTQPTLTNIEVLKTNTDTNANQQPLKTSDVQPTSVRDESAQVRGKYVVSCRVNNKKSKAQRIKTIAPIKAKVHFEEAFNHTMAYHPRNLESIAYFNFVDALPARRPKYQNTQNTSKPKYSDTSKQKRKSVASKADKTSITEERASKSPSPRERCNPAEKFTLPMMNFRTNEASSHSQRPTINSPMNCFMKMIRQVSESKLPVVKKDKYKLKSPQKQQKKEGSRRKLKDLISEVGSSYRFTTTKPTIKIPLLAAEIQNSDSYNQNIDKLNIKRDRKLSRLGNNSMKKLEIKQDKDYLSSIKQVPTVFVQPFLQYKWQ